MLSLKLQEVEMASLIDKARAFAMYAHRSQQRKYTGTPYFWHVHAVATMVFDITGDEEATAAAYLHDALEDTDVPASLLGELFGQRVLDLVLMVTDVSRKEDGNRAVRKAKDRDHLALADSFGQTIKLADLIDNSRSITAHDPAFAKVYLKEKADLLKVLTKGDQHLYGIAEQILKEHGHG